MQVVFVVGENVGCFCCCFYAMPFDNIVQHAAIVVGRFDGDSSEFSCAQREFWLKTFCPPHSSAIDFLSDEFDVCECRRTSGSKQQAASTYFCIKNSNRIRSSILHNILSMCTENLEGKFTVATYVRVYKATWNLCPGAASV